jgi:lysozyme family protein
MTPADSRRLSNSTIVDHILESEGWPAFTNDPDDAGGATKGGITLATLRDHFNDPGLTADDLQDLDEAEAREIYEEAYIVEPGFVEIPDPLLRWQVVDCGVLSGTARAVEWLQRAICEAHADIAIDGIWGPQTEGAVQHADPHRTGLWLAHFRIRYLGSIISSNHRQRESGHTSQDWSKYAGGWMNRATMFIEMEATR